MKILIMILLVLLLASNSFAIIDNTPNSIGLYWDEEANIVDGVSYEPFMNGYLCITNPTFSTLKAIEMMLQPQIGDELLHWGGITGSYLGGLQGFMGFEPPVVCASCASPIPTSPVMPILRILIFPIEGFATDPRIATEQIAWYVKPAPNPSIPGAIVILPAHGEDLIELIPVAPYGEPVARLNGTGVVAAKISSWGDLKSLYR